MKILIPVILFASMYLLFYIFGTFISWEPDVSKWEPGSRFAMIFGGTVFGILAAMGGGLLLFERT